MKNIEVFFRDGSLEGREREIRKAIIMQLKEERKHKERQHG